MVKQYDKNFFTRSKPAANKSSALHSPCSMMRILSIIAYFFIFLQGSMIQIPFGLLLLTGLFEGEPIMRVLIALADISLITLLIISFNKKTNTSLAIEIISYFVLLLPLLKIVSSFPFKMFNYF